MDGKICLKSELQAKLGICNEMVQKYRLEAKTFGIKEVGIVRHVAVTLRTTFWNLKIWHHSERVSHPNLNMNIFGIQS